MIIDLDYITELESNLFSIKKQDLLPRVRNPDIVMDVLFEVSLDKSVVLRESLHLLDLLGDIGGVSSLLFGFLQFMLFFINYNHFDSFMTSKLFKIKKPADEE